MPDGLLASLERQTECHQMIFLLLTPMIDHQSHIHAIRNAILHSNKNQLIIIWLI